MVLSPVAGVLADRLPRIAIIIASQMVSGLSQAVSAVLVLTGTAKVWELALLALLSGAAGAFFQPAGSGPGSADRGRVGAIPQYRDSSSTIPYEIQVTWVSSSGQGWWQPYRNPWP
jgi:MFS family permease